MGVHHAGKARLRPLQWLLIAWPAGDAEPSRYIRSTPPEDTPINERSSAAHQRWRIERDYPDLKQDFGLGHHEGRGWRGFHHLATLSIAAYGFPMAERLLADKPVGGKKTPSNAQCLPCPRIASRAAVLRAQRHVEHSITALRLSLSYARLARIGQSPCCGRVSAKLLSRHSKRRRRPLPARRLASSVRLRCRSAPCRRRAQPLVQEDDASRRGDAGSATGCVPWRCTRQPGAPNAAGGAKWCEVVPRLYRWNGPRRLTPLPWTPSVRASPTPPIAAAERRPHVPC